VKFPKYFWHWLKHEPFIHFIFIGAIIFVTAHFRNAGTVAPNHKISIDAQDIERLRYKALAQRGKEPDDEQIQALVRNYVREEVLVREARTQGFDRDDVVVRRRLAQKMEFLATQSIDSPSESEVSQYFQTHIDQYILKPTLSLEQMVFRIDTRGVYALAQAKSALLSLQEGHPGNGDTSMLPSKMDQMDAARMQGDFEASFTNAAFSAPIGQWIGPVQSALGYHLIRVTAKQSASNALYKIVHDRVKADLISELGEAAREKAYVELLKKYSIAMNIDQIAPRVNISDNASQKAPR
jgi:parvulin-like peptidyl-prolyl isomerase